MNRPGQHDPEPDKPEPPPQPPGEIPEPPVEDPPPPPHPPPPVVARPLRRVTRRCGEAMEDWRAVRLHRYPHEPLLSRMWSLRDN
ncbi:MAG: hypothetical protein AB7T58_17475 [Hyphomonadaceae bacterium]